MKPTLNARVNAGGLSRGPGYLKLRRLSLQDTFYHVDAVAPAGARVAVTGPNGSGKSRLLRLISGMRAPSSGTIVLDRQNTTARRLQSLRRMIAMAGPDTPLIGGSVYDNVIYGQRVSESEAKHILDLGGYEDLISVLPEGAKTSVGRRGNKLSQGQQQRVKLIRALMRKPVVLLLDEVEANLDESGVRVLERIFDTFEGTIIMVTHTNSWIRRCDTRWHLENRKLTEYDQSAPTQGCRNVC